MTRIKILLAALVLCSQTTLTNAQQIVPIPIPGSPLTLNVVANPLPLQNLNINPAATNVTMGDDSNVNVPLGFKFPYFGQNFTNSWMYSNGGISFQGPNVPGGYCCSGQPLSRNLNSAYNYSILPLWTDLIASSPYSSHYILGNNNSMTYGWYNVSEYGTNNNNSFEVKIDSTGGVDMRYSGAYVSLNHNVTIGLVGNAQNGEYYQYYNGSGLQLGQTQLAFVDPCVMDPLSSPTCPGYQQAYYMQQCSINPLYDLGCPGYQQAYFTQQCSIDPLYNMGCPGYAEAYLTQQCNKDPLYSTSCLGYADAYKKKLIADACKANPQSNFSCPGYVIATAGSNTTSTVPATITTEAVVQQVTNSTSVANTTSNPATPIAVATQTIQTVVAQPTTQTTTQSTTQKAETTPTATIEKKTSNATEAKKQVAEKAKEAASASSNAKTIEAQAIAQNTVVGLMGYVPGFSAYQNMVVPDTNMTNMMRKYSKDTVDNRSVSRQLSGSSDRKWNEMVGSQYK